ncbi:DUF4373 domain-containing protein [Clostridium sp. JN-1]|uniref:DUF4373 domain-containing protein n=1 Tax=Clostridium sp. JN-1 TaxID=2483110 RepID=UPI000F0B3E7E|nr:DUF4373 domain-containing protein [Clostridium sp. JN-1]
MARPQKEGLEYFPLDVDMDQDDKVALIEAQHGLVGFGVVVKLLMKIYKHGYFYEWTEKQQLLFSKRVNVDINSLNAIINDCVKWELFDKNAFETYNVLTSKGIQRRYIEAVGRRQKVKIYKEYLLLDDETINVYKNLVIVDINSNNEEVNANINPQSKVKESKVKKSKEEREGKKVSDDRNSLSEKSLELCKYYETLKPGESISKHVAALNVFIKTYGYDWCKEALLITISNKNSFIKEYMAKILKNWAANGKESSTKNVKYGCHKESTFNNFEQRDYDFKDLERKLLGIDGKG